MGDGGGRTSPDRGERTRDSWAPLREDAPRHHLSLVTADVSARTGARLVPTQAPRLSEALVEHLIAVALDPDPAWRVHGVSRLQAHGLDAAAILDLYVPEAARRLGERWLEDRASFAEVTIATAALQALVRELSVGPPAGWEPRASAPLVAMVVRDGETHTLGASVAAARLRRAGASVMLLMGRSDSEVVRAVRGGDLAMVCLSASAREDRATLASMIGALRAASGAPVVLGGSILCGEEGARGLGADHTTDDPEAALRLCGLAAATHRTTVR